MTYSTVSVISSLEDALHEGVTPEYIDGISCTSVSPDRLTLALAANAQYFGHPQWGRSYFEACHRDRAFIDRWQAATGSWDDKIVVDIGCGPGNVFASVGGRPKLLIGVDISFGALKMAAELGYQPLLADAQQLPLRSQIADIVVVNATLHHCDDMTQALREAARLVKPGGVLVCDHDPQQTAWHYKGLARFIWEARLPLYRWIERGGHASKCEQECALASEAHHVPGDGVTADWFRSVLDPVGFSTRIFPHNHDLGAEIFQGNIGRSASKYRIAQRFSGIDPDSPEAALSLMCVAQREVSK
ncbi:class I SAM-dependent methyltransferase [Baaleninema simplex]|uniref:class I SAM-dependent methyltransferase n=1 Tax=Baaleninema simplex TaxID=2862350 RepID=UPI0003603D68|nr:class I SAM-dependent methyltransferase [Baaleninema simplex]